MIVSLPMEADVDEGEILHIGGTAECQIRLPQCDKELCSIAVNNGRAYLNFIADGVKITLNNKDLGLDENIRDGSCLFLFAQDQAYDLIVHTHYPEKWWHFAGFIALALLPTTLGRITGNFMVYAVLAMLNGGILFGMSWKVLNKPQKMMWRVYGLILFVLGLVWLWSMFHQPGSIWGHKFALLPFNGGVI